VSTSDAAALVAARLVAHRINAATAYGGRFKMAMSGGRTPWSMLHRLTSPSDKNETVKNWALVDVFQVDERVAPDGDDQRNLTRIRQFLDGTSASVHPMPVTSSDLETAADLYAEILPTEFDLILLGMGGDGHTASLVPGDAVLEITDVDVAISGTYQGTERMTLTYPRLARSRELIWLVTGVGKNNAMEAWRRHDEVIPAGRINHPRQIMVTDIW